MRCGITIVGATILISPAFGQGYPPGPARDAFINAGQKTCFERQINADENTNFTVGEMRSYCNCYITNLANTLTKSARDAGLESPEAQQQIERAAKPCLEAIKPR